MNSYRIKKERERIIFSSLIVFSAFLFVILVSYIFNLFKFEDFTDYSGPVKITFGSPDAEIVTNEILPIPETTESAEEVIETETTTEEVAPKEVIQEKTNTIPEKKVIEKKEVKPTEATTAKEVIEESKPVIQKGRESGNSHETSFESSSSDIGRRAYFPIVDYMPLPTIISSTVYNSVNGDITGFGEEGYNKRIIDNFYFKSDNIYSLKSKVPYQNRPDLWEILEKAGYDVNNAEYKTGKKLKSVIIVFEIASNSSGINSIISAKIDSSSGDKEIDEAVLYGFKRSTYSNSTENSVKGRFKYSFN